MDSSNKKSLVVYYSRKGNNYVNGKIVYLPEGNTKIIANKLQGITGGDLFEIETTKPYPDDYYETTKISKVELKNDARPELVEIIKTIEPYEVIYLGYPNWWGTMPMAVFSFLEYFDFAGKKIAPFCTHEGSGLGKSESDIKRLCFKADILPGLSIRGSNVSRADSIIKNWMKDISLLIK